MIYMSLNNIIQHVRMCCNIVSMRIVPPVPVHYGLKTSFAAMHWLHFTNVPNSSKLLASGNDSFMTQTQKESSISIWIIKDKIKNIEKSQWMYFQKLTRLVMVKFDLQMASIAIWTGLARSLGYLEAIKCLCT